VGVLLDVTLGFHCTNAWRSMEGAPAEHWAPVPAVALIDIGLPGMSGIEGLRSLRERYSAVALMVLTVFDDEERIFDTLCSGASGYLLKGTPPARLLESIREVVAGGAPMSPENGAWCRFSGRSGRPRSTITALHRMNYASLKLLVDCHTYKSAASEMGIAFRTIAFYVQNGYQKLQVNSKSEAVARASGPGSPNSVLVPP
jgi:DNA-binding NarL/FixJ family response regulator